MVQTRTTVAVLAATLRAIMRRKKIGVAKLSGASGVDKGTINHMLGGHHAARLDKLDAVARALKVPPWRLLMDEPVVGEDEVSGLEELVDDYNKADVTGRHSILTVAELAARAHPKT
jgi:transcriptional regulator with XRE-family HTH domain